MNSITSSLIDTSHVNLFSLLNVEGRKLVVYKIRSILEVIVSIIYFGNPSQMYLKGLLGIATELVECMFLNDNALYPTVRRDATFISILDKFNKLQRAEEVATLALLNRVNCIEPPTEAVLPTTISTAKP